MEMERNTMHQGFTICPICHNHGWVYFEKDGIEYARKCDCNILEREIEERKLKFAAIPENFRGMRLSNFGLSVYKLESSKETLREISKIIKYWLSNFEKMFHRNVGLYIYSGTKGSGKTRFAVSIANELMDRGIPVKFSTSLQILNEIRNTWGKRNEEESRLLNELKNVDVLIIDDFGIQSGDWVDTQFYDIINGRYINKKMTIFTSNMSVDDLQCDERIKNRIKEMTFQILFPEESVRDHIANDLKKEMLSYIKMKEEIKT